MIFKVVIIACYSTMIFSNDILPKVEKNNFLKKEVQKKEKNDLEKKSQNKGKQNKKNIKAKISTITWAFDPWVPFHKIDRKSKKVNGILVDLVSEIIENDLSLSLNYKELPWKRAQNEAKTGESDFIVTVPTKERSEYSVASEKEIFNLQNRVIFYHKNKNKKNILKWKSIKDIRKSGLTGVTQTGDGWWKAELQGIKTEYVRDIFSVLKMLVSGRADFAIISEIEAFDIISKKYKKDDFISGVVVDSSPFHILVSKKSKYIDKIKEIDKSIKKLEKKLKTIIENFSH